ncbi:MAG: hypothetical protein U0234_11790 [Sandaracinus sp.]
MSARGKELSIVLGYVLVHAAVAAFFVLRRDPGTDAAWIGFPLDDAWIHDVYARSLAHGGLFEYVPGRPEAGFTSPLWVVALAPIWAVTSDPRMVALATKVLGVALSAGLSVLADRLATRLSGERRVGLVAGLLVALDPSLAFAAVSGMEVSLAAAAMLGGLLAWLEDRPGLAGGLFAAALLARPECALVTVLLAGLEARRVSKSERAARLARLLVPSAIAGGLWSGFCLVVAGRPLPNTFYAKHHPHSLLDVVSDVPRMVGPQLLAQSWFFLGSGFVLLGLAVVRIGRDAKLDRERRLGVLLGPLVFLAGIAWAHDILFVRAFATLRYVLPHQPWTLALVAVGAREALPRVLALRTERAARPLAIGAIATASLVLPLAVLPMRLDRSARDYAWNCQNIEEMQVRIGLWLHEHTRPGEWVATHDAGAIRIFSDRPVLDLAGLNEHRVSSVGAGLFAEVHPRYFVVFPTWFPHMTQSPRYRGVFSAPASHYTICPCTSTELRVLEPLDHGSVLDSASDLESGADQGAEGAQ